MKLYLLAATLFVAATSAGATPLKGPWVDVRAGWDNVDSGGSKSGIVYGGALGYDVPVGANAFIGAQVGGYGSTVKECSSGVCVKPGRDLEALARVGFMASDDAAIYALGGYANGRVSADFIGGDSLSGYRLGVGFEQASDQHLLYKVEYRYSHYSGTLFGFDANVKRHQVLFTVGYRF